MKKKFGLGGHATTYMMRVYSLASAVLSGTWAFGLVWIMGQHPDIFTVELWYQLTWGIFLVAASLYGYYMSNHRIAVLIPTFSAIYGASEYVWTPFIRLSRVFWAWSFMGVMQAAYGLLMLVGVGFSILHLIFIPVLRIKEKKRRTDRHLYKGHFVNFWQRFNKEWQSKKAVHLGFLIVIAASAFASQALNNNWFIPPNATVTLDPPDYQIKFQAYGRSLYTNYTGTQRDSLNRHHFRIISNVGNFIDRNDYATDPYLWYMNLTNFKQTQKYNDTRNEIINRFNPWKSGAPNVTFLVQLVGTATGFSVTDYSLTSGFWGLGPMLLNAWLTLEVIVEANLTNVVGFHTDQEDVPGYAMPLEGYPPDNITVYRDEDRNLQARNNYLAFFNLMRYHEQNNAMWATFFSDMNSIYGVDHFLFTTTYGGALMDGLDNDWDMDVFSLNNVNSLPYDEFLPMLYNQHRFPPDGAHYALYMQMKTLERSLETAGYPGRIGALLGCMAADGSMFRSDYTGTQLVDGTQQTVDGFAVVARQAMIAKAFGCEYVSFFPLNPYLGEGFRGIFQTFGDTFFDDLNATVNAPDSGDPFTIRYYPDAEFGQTDLGRDMFLSDGWDWWYFGALIGCFVFVWIHHKFFPNIRSPRSPDRAEPPSKVKKSS
ncbi:MAG: hypothetical protein ACFFCS_00255 [Candidatus Hodarchaeota archaeon]